MKERNQIFKIENLLWIEPEEFILLCLSGKDYVSHTYENKKKFEIKDKLILLTFENDGRTIHLFKNDKLINSLKEPTCCFYRDTNKAILEFVEL